MTRLLSSGRRIHLNGAPSFWGAPHLFGFILLRRPTVILLDEPDVHLHGSLQAVLLNELKALVDSGKQVLVATHSRELITRVSPEDILALDDHGAAHLRVAYDIYNTLDRLGSLDPSQLAIVQAFRRVLVVEDASDKDLLSVMAAKIVGSDVWQRCERQIAFCFSKGNPWKQHDMARLHGMLSQMLSIAGQPLELFVIADRDYYPDLGELRGRLPSDHIQWHVWHRAELESYLLIPEALKRLVKSQAQARQLELDEVRFQHEYDRLIASSRDLANDQLVKAFDTQRKFQNAGWDAATLARKAREFLNQHWDADNVALADAKEVVLPGLKRWLQENGFGQFSDRRLAEAIRPEELPDEVHEVVRNIVRFAGIEPPPAAV